MPVGNQVVEHDLITIPITKNRANALGKRHRPSLFYQSSRS